MTKETLACRLQYTNISASASREVIRRHCETAAEHGFHAVMIQPCWISLAREILRGTDVRVASAIAYPMGGETTTMKVAMAREIVAIGADEFDFQPNIGFLRSQMLREFVREIRLVVEAADGRPVKSMSEFGFLTEAQRIQCITLAEEAGVAYVKNSSGVGPGGSAATPEEIGFIRKHLAGRARIKASGGIRSHQQACALVEAGAVLIGTSNAPEIVDRTSPTYGDY
jgi:deoxyribose-phosphate aldolase